MKKVLNLTNKVVVELKPVSPFAFDPSMHKPDHFPSQDTDWIGGCRWQTMRWEGECLGLKFVNAGTIKRPKINLEIYFQDKLTSDYIDSLIDEVNYRYDFQADLADFTERFKGDEQLGPILKRWPGMRIMSPQSLYEYLVIGIVLQNCTVRRSVNMMQVLFENYGTPLIYDGKNLYCFWEPRALTNISEQELRDLKVGYRAKSLKRISEPFAKNEIDEMELRTKDKEEQREALINWVTSRRGSKKSTPNFSSVMTRPILSLQRNCSSSLISVSANTRCSLSIIFGRICGGGESIDRFSGWKN